MARLNGDKCPTCGRFKKTQNLAARKLIDACRRHPHYPRADEAHWLSPRHDLCGAYGCEARLPGQSSGVIPRVVLTREQFDHLTALLKEGMTWREIGELQQLTEQTIGHHYRQACKIYGKPVIKKSAGDDHGGRSNRETQLEITFACTN